jgi:predicted GNAT family acetyltransferase
VDDASEPEVRHDTERQRYEIWVDDVRAGLTTYEEQDDAIAFLHTEIKDEFGGRGLASTLIGTALDDVRGSGRSVLPYCPFVRAYIQKHPEYADLVPLARRAQFGLPEPA